MTINMRRNIHCALRGLSYKAGHSGMDLYTRRRHLALTRYTKDWLDMRLILAQEGMQ